AGCGWLFPEAFEEFRKVIPPEERGDMIAAYYRRLTDPNREVQIAAARAWSIWEGSTLSLMQDPERLKLFGADTYAIAFARIECHSFVNRDFFAREDQLLANVHRIRHLPCTIVHGRYDVVTPVKSAWDLARLWPEADLRIVGDAGHAMTEPGIVHELVGATRRHAGIPTGEAGLRRPSYGRRPTKVPKPCFQARAPSSDAFLPDAGSSHSAARQACFEDLPCLALPESDTTPRSALLRCVSGRHCMADVFSYSRQNAS